MPQAKKPKIDTETIDPKELDNLVKAVEGGSEAPTSAEQTKERDAFKRFRDQPGPPFDAENITILQMRQMRKAPMIAFSLHYRKVPVVRGRYYVQARDKNGPNAQVAAFYDACIRMIWGTYALQRLLTLDFGYQAIVKQWQFANPGGVFADRINLDENGNPVVQPIWDEGNILPRIWKPFATLRPERVYPRFVDTGPNAGDFDGIDYELPRTAGQRTFRTAGKGKQSKQGIKEISVFNSLWATHQRQEEHGDYYGFPLTGFARDYWWDYLFAAGLDRRAIERIAIPPIIGFHPLGFTTDEETGERVRNRDVALEMAERLRSNAVAAVPSTMAETGIDGATSGTQRAWDFKYMDVPKESLDVLNTKRNYFNIMQLRSTWTPEMAFLGNESGNSGGNIAEQMQEVFFASQELLMLEILDEIDKYMGPQLLWLNFPEFVNNGGKAKIVFQGFHEEDVDLAKQIIQLFGQKSPEILAEIDTHDLLMRVGLPLKDPAILEAERQFLVDKGLPTGPPLVGATPGNVGTIANPNLNPGFTNGGSAPQVGNTAAGFAMQPDQQFVYVNPQESINLEFSDADEYLASLPQTKHYSDKTIRALSVQLRKVWQAHYRRLFNDFARYLNAIKVELSDRDTDFEFGADGMITLADRRRIPSISKTKANKAANKIMKEFAVGSAELAELRKKSGDIIRKILERAARLEARDANIEIDISDDEVDNYILDQVGLLTKRTHQTFTDDVKGFIVREIIDGKSGPDIADSIVAHYQTQQDSRSERVARSETRDAVNAATLLSGKSGNVRYVRAKDAQIGKTDPLCEERNGKLFTIREAWKELRNTHPYDTLEFELVPRANFSIEPIHNGSWPKDKKDFGAFYDEEKQTVFYLANEVTDLQLAEYVINLSERLETNGNN